MKSITKMFGNHDDDLGLSPPSHRQWSDQPANPNNTSPSVDFRER